MKIVMSWLDILRKVGQKAGPYLVLEMLLPGGTLFALLLFLWQRRRPDIRSGAQRAVLVVTRAWAGAGAAHFGARADTMDLLDDKIAYPQVTLGRG
jgi:uncharacterized membrane protein